MRPRGAGSNTRPWRVFSGATNGSTPRSYSRLGAIIGGYGNGRVIAQDGKVRDVNSGILDRSTNFANVPGLSRSLTNSALSETDLKPALDQLCYNDKH